MKKKKQYAMNKLFNCSIILFVFFAWIAIDFFIHNNNVWGLGFGIVAILVIVLSSVFTPYCYAFDEKGVSLCYVFLPVERYLWKDIRSIEVEDKSINSPSHANIFNFFYAYVFIVRGMPVGKCRFYMNGHIRKSFRTKYLLEKYWNGTITGYLFEDVKNWFVKRKAKKHRNNKQKRG